MNLPPRSDPRWRALVQDKQVFTLKGLATRMVLTRVRVIGSRKDEASVKEAMNVAYDYFAKNLEAARDDIVTIFGH
jgi:hypothetical protein